MDRSLRTTNLARTAIDFARLESASILEHPTTARSATEGCMPCPVTQRKPDDQENSMSELMNDWRDLADLRAQLDRHPVYGGVRTREDLQCFMSHHVFPVWDFMSLAKSLQEVIAPARAPWRPLHSPQARRFINQIVLEEESDIGPPNGGAPFLSHFELYCQAMAEVDADAQPALRFLTAVGEHGIDTALGNSPLPEPARKFMRTTFDLIATGKPHVIAAAFTWGREHVIPPMFRALLERLGVGEQAAPSFHFYLRRHIHLDEDSHAPLSLRLLDELCGGNPTRFDEARVAARRALAARIGLWDGVARALDASAQARRA
jgi:hypothetical protein